MATKAVEVGQNVRAEVIGDELIIHINLKGEHTLSAPDAKTGVSKSLVLASTRGNRPVFGLDERITAYSLGVNFYKPRGA